MNGVNYAYTYDGNGNILAANVGGTAHTYTYGNSVWKDLLTAYDGQTITYDDIGNPLAYLNGMTFTWQNGRELTTMTKNGVTTTYAYNADGGRYTKTVGDTVTQYYYLGGKLYAETTGNNTIVYLYDETGTPYAFTLNGTKYYYEYNLMGDVIGLFDNTGTRVVRYYYTPYGDLASMVDNTTTGVGSINPIRYRGYYYDTETGFYYCGSRYYDPEIGRWINADGYVSTGQGILSYNMFAYCGNNPVNYSDPTGGFSIKALFQKVGNRVKGYLESFANDYSGPSIDAITGAAPSVAPSVAAGITYKLSKGWKARIDSQDTNTKVKRHIHVSRDGEHYAQCEDGEPHDGTTGTPPKSVLKELKQTVGWDWNKKAGSWANKNNYFILHYCPVGALDSGDCVCTTPFIGYGPLVNPVVSGNPYALPISVPYQAPVPWVPVPVG